jgi:peptidoglycan hydrolase CwlO-like protein
MTQIEEWQHKIELLEREQRYLEDDIQDLRERIAEEQQLELEEY